MSLLLLAFVIQLVSTVCFFSVVRHAFNRSVGTGVLVLLIPLYNVVYAFSQFEHRAKGLVIAGWLAGVLFAIVLRTYGLALLNAH